MGEAVSQCAPDIVMIAQQIACGENQIVEVELSARTLVVAITLQNRAHFFDQRRQGLASRSLNKRNPGVAAGGVVGVGSVVQPVAVSLGEACLLCCGSPFALLAIGGEGAVLLAKIRMGSRGQEPDEARRCCGIATARQGGRHVGQPLDDRHRFRLDSSRPVHEAREIRCGLPECRQIANERGDRRGVDADSPRSCG